MVGMTRGVVGVTWGMYILQSSVLSPDYLSCLREDLQRLKLPLNIEDAKELGRCLSKYKDSHYYTVLSAFFLTYILYPPSTV